MWRHWARVCDVFDANAQVPMHSLLTCVTELGQWRGIVLRSFRSLGTWLARCDLIVLSKDEIAFHFVGGELESASPRRVCLITATELVKEVGLDRWQVLVSVQLPVVL